MKTWKSEEGKARCGRTCIIRLIRQDSAFQHFISSAARYIAITFSQYSTVLDCRRHGRVRKSGAQSHLFAHKNPAQLNLSQFGITNLHNLIRPRKRSVSTMKSLFLQSSILVSLATGFADGRDWHDVIDHAEYRQSGVDTARMQLRIEWDTSIEGYDPHSHSKVTTMPSAAPTVGPCHEGTVHYQVNMYDSSGNGWERTTMKVVGIEDQEPVEASDSTTSTTTHTLSTNRGNGFVSISNSVEFGSGAILTNEPEHVFPLGVIFESELTRGSYDFADICLVLQRCYDVVVNGGDLLEEVTWDITAMVDNAEQEPTPYLQGKAPMYCKFSIPDAEGQLFCPIECTEQIPEQYIDNSPHLTDILYAPVDSKDGGSPFSSLFQNLYQPPEESKSAPQENEFASLLTLGESTTVEKQLIPEDPVPESDPSPVPEQGEAENEGFQNLLRAGGDRT
jgi:hypothetical protein